MTLPTNQSAPHQFQQVPPASGPLSSGDLLALSDGRLRARKLRRAARIAHFSGWTMIVFGVLTLLMVLLGDVVAAILGAALLAAGFVELRGGAMLARFDPAGPTLLMWNQVCVGAMLVAYCAWSLSSSLKHPILEQVGGSTGDRQMDALVTDLSFTLTYGLYGGVILIGITAPGLTAWYYFSRGSLIREMLAQTPAWVIAAMRAAD